MNMFNNIKDADELWKYMMENIKYGWTDKEGKFWNYNENMDNYFVHSPEETVNNKSGICIDDVELERAFLESKGITSKTYSINVNLPDGRKFGHVFLIYFDNNKWYYFERALESCANITEYDSLSDALKTVVHLYLAVFEISDADIKYTELKEYNNVSYGWNRDDWYKNVELNNPNIIDKYIDKNNFKNMFYENDESIDLNK